MSFHLSPLHKALLIGLTFAGLLIAVRVMQLHEPRLRELADSPAASIPNQVCAEDPQSCAAKTYFPLDGP